MLKENTTLVLLARAFLTQSLTHNIGGFGGLGDLIPQPNDQVHIKLLDKLLDITHFRERLEEAVNDGTLPESDRKDIKRFLDAWNACDRSRS